MISRRQLSQQWWAWPPHLHPLLPGSLISLHGGLPIALISTSSTDHEIMQELFKAFWLTAARSAISPLSSQSDLFSTPKASKATQQPTFWPCACVKVSVLEDLIFECLLVQPCLHHPDCLCSKGVIEWIWVAACILQMIKVQQAIDIWCVQIDGCWFLSHGASQRLRRLGSTVAPCLRVPNWQLSLPAWTVSTVFKI
jgi:hypothetical protein